MSFDIIHNDNNSIYLIINIKLEFNEDNNLALKSKYYDIIIFWIKHILDEYNISYNWNIYITNLNYQYFRIFIYLDKHNYLKLDNTNLLYISNIFDNFKLNIDIIQFSKLFSYENFKKVVEIENKNENIQIENNNSDYDTIIYKTNFNINIEECNIKSIGISGVNKNTFIYELKKINIIKNSDIYYNNIHNIYYDHMYKKIKENNEYYWIIIKDLEENNKINNLINIIDKKYFNFNKLDNNLDLFIENIK